jgi:hypothetical protein
MCRKAAPFLFHERKGAGRPRGSNPMKIKYLSGPKAGQIEYVQNQIGNVVVGAGLAEIALDPTAPGAGPRLQPQWSVEEMDKITTARFLAIRLLFGAQDAFYAGDPDALTVKTFGRAVPDATFQDYKQRWKANPGLRKWIAPAHGPRTVRENEEAARELADANAVRKGAYVPPEKKIKLIVFLNE